MMMMSSGKDIVEITREPLSVDRITDLVNSPDCGAISMFIGTIKFK